MSSCEVLVTVKSVSRIYGLLVYSQKRRHYTLNRVPCGPQVRSGCFEKIKKERKKFVDSEGNTSMFFGSPAHCLVTVLTAIL